MFKKGASELMKTNSPHRRRVRQQTLADDCPDCGKLAAWKTTTRLLPQEFRGHTFEIESTCQECSHCGFRILTDAQIDGLRKATVKAYQEEAGLLTGVDITEARKKMKWSQADLAEHTGLGIASVKRWELGLMVQTGANDSVLRQALASALDGAFCFLHLHMGVFQVQCFTETWQQGWDVEARAVPSISCSATRAVPSKTCWDSSLALA
jgi:putative zinc finger/helix-turn-helix YgiT family protein